LKRNAKRGASTEELGSEREVEAALSCHTKAKVTLRIDDDEGADDAMISIPIPLKTNVQYYPKLL
jgi:hypothetical protein